jgi:hypothetical protein
MVLFIRLIILLAVLPEVMFLLIGVNRFLFPGLLRLDELFLGDWWGFGLGGLIIGHKHLEVLTHMRGFPVLVVVNQVYLFLGRGDNRLCRLVGFCLRRRFGLRLEVKF